MTLCPQTPDPEVLEYLEDPIRLHNLRVGAIEFEETVFTRPMFEFFPDGASCFHMHRDWCMCVGDMQIVSLPPMTREEENHYLATGEVVLQAGMDPTEPVSKEYQQVMDIRNITPLGTRLLLEDGTEKECGFFNYPEMRGV